MNWKEEFEKHSSKLGVVNVVLTSKAIDFISTEIIEKLIEEIPDSPNESREKDFVVVNGSKLKQQLRDKWL